ncbi:MAG: SOS response-associated peptidase family protein [Hyphomonadaceae bacterium]|nr:SOS response-associated peptidase family protein [Hyphomonadaceae bacterium]
MCGKFTQMATWAEVHAFSQPLTLTPEAATVTVTPMRFAKVLHLDESGVRRLSPMRWGFADRRAENPSRPKHMHARSETIDEKPTFAEAFAQRRGVLPVATFNEGLELANGKTQQWTITPPAPLGIAVIYEEWRKDDETLLTFVMATTPPNPLIARITDRMPAILAFDDWPLWLGETDAPREAVKALLAPHDDAGAWAMAEEAKAGRGRPPRRAGAASQPPLL